MELLEKLLDYLLCFLLDFLLGPENLNFSVHLLQVSGLLLEKLLDYLLCFLLEKLLDYLLESESGRWTGPNTVPDWYILLGQD